MESLQMLASIIFLGSIVLVITGWIDSVIAAMIGDHCDGPLRCHDRDSGFSIR